MGKDSQVKKRGAGEGRSTGTAGGPGVQGEGDYESARRYRKDVQKFVQTADVERAAREAAPRNAQEAAEMEAAEKAGRERARQSAGKKKSG
jgi:hypothetical protein